MSDLHELTTDELETVTGGAIASYERDPRTGEIIIRDCTGQEIGREPA